MALSTKPATVSIEEAKQVSLNTFIKHACAVLETNKRPILTPSAFRPWHSTLSQLQDSKDPELVIPECVSKLTWRGSDSYPKSEEVVDAFRFLDNTWTIFAPDGLKYRFSLDWPRRGDSCLRDALEELERMPDGYKKAVERLAEGVSCEIQSVQGLGMGMFASVEWKPVSLRGEPKPIPGQSEA